MMSRRIMDKFLIFLLASASTTHAAIIHPLDEKRVLEVRISQEGLTRIKVEEDRILRVFGRTGDYVLETDEDQGQVFIRPTTLETSKPISLTLTTEAGHTQDLRLIPKDQAPEALILKIDADITQEIEKEKQASAPLFREEVESLIQACQEGRIPLGYKEIPLSIHTIQKPYLLTREIQGPKLRGLTYRVHNDTQEPLILSEQEFADELFLQANDLVALLISKKTLAPEEGTDIYVVARAN